MPTSQPGDATRRGSADSSLQPLKGACWSERRPGLRKFCLVVSAIVIFVGVGAVGGCSTAKPAPTSTTRTTQATTTTLSSAEIRARRDQSYRPLKGIYLTSNSASSAKLMAGFLRIADQTEINAFVIDLKDNSGYVTYNCDAPLAKSLGLVRPTIKDVDSLIATLVKHDITPIARIVAFQDSPLAKKRPDLAVKSKKTGGNWPDRKGVMYTNPYSHVVWEYLTEVAEDAAKHGFREIQFDYVRFPSDGSPSEPLSDAVYPGGSVSSKEDAIAGFLAFARARLEKLGVWVSADVFGVIVKAKNDNGIGQQFEKTASNVDIVCPMLYPSHWVKGSYGFANPNANPYSIISLSLKDMKPRLAGTGAKGRPWLQDFTLGKPAYGVAEVKAEIKAAEDQGFNEWILWNASNKYTVAALRPS
jgi:hypothetical protein